MLGKLFKYEFKNTSKIMFVIYGVMLFVTILGCIAMYGNSNPAGTENKLQEIFFTAAMVFYVLGVFALFVVSYVYMCVHFYKTMYSDQGYLTHTLPVNQMSIFHVKLLVSLCWLLLSLIILFLSIFALGCAANRGFSFDVDFDMFLADFQNMFGMSFGTFLPAVSFDGICQWFYRSALYTTQNRGFHWCRNHLLYVRSDFIFHYHGAYRIFRYHEQR